MKFLRVGWKLFWYDLVRTWPACWSLQMEKYSRGKPIIRTARFGKVERESHFLSYDTYCDDLRMSHFWKMALECSRWWRTTWNVEARRPIWSVSCCVSDLWIMFLFNRCVNCCSFFLKMHVGFMSLWGLVSPLHDSIIKCDLFMRCNQIQIEAFKYDRVLLLYFIITVRSKRPVGFC